MTRARFIQATVALTILTALIQCVWAFVMPPFRGPDEPHHTNSIFRLASGNGWPEPGEAMVDPSVMTAAKEAGLLLPWATEFTTLDRSKLYQGEIDPNLFATTIVTEHGVRSVISDVEGADPEATVRDQMVQHPPAYYAGGALVVKALGLDGMQWDRALNALRLYSIMWALPLVPSMVYVARKLGAAREWSIMAGLIPLAIPQLSAVIGTVTNDAMVVGTSALAIAFMVKAAKEPVSLLNIGLVGGSVGLALWSKGQVLALGLPLILVFLIAKGSWAQKIGGALGAGLLSQIICPWWLLNIIRYGAIQPDGFGRTPFEGWDPADVSIGQFLSVAWTTINESFVARFGWLEVELSDFIVYNLLFAFAIFWILGIIGMKDRLVPLAIATAVPGILLIILRQSWKVYVETGYIAGMQGRYLYPFLALLAVCVIGLARAFYSQRLTWSISATIALALNAFGMWALLYASYFGDPINFERFSLVVGFSQRNIYLVLAGYIALILIALVVFLAASRMLPRRAEVMADAGFVGAGERPGKHSPDHEGRDHELAVGDEPAGQPVSVEPLPDGDRGDDAR